ncbi:M56 family metallopeptidase [Polymorphobacter fuscus]|uniref:Peptidase M56 domain-containing protein n=1 Tax=Sandarakinorhabdus fusca TaxID=1439888 RepID=A0A7C9GPX7_9SPHN|nr:M56 family metallopeptidase [Polymorphobacter fuscus]KAB7645417.1 M56 family metallopeptidase [Polymorphobacter fuscus]MQT17837.1 hypothetical protein [Polymorphobacter fuscus]NJC08466.1 beta-lactamase regulating signal transducer with metallopeptidase domain [Polymorphobacter fuscus]
MSWLVEALVGSSLLMLLVLAVRRPVARLFGAHVAYALWLLPPLRLVLPALPGWTTFYVPVAEVGDPVRVGLVDPATAAQLPATATAGVDWALPMLGLWAAGAVLWIGWQLLRHRRFLQQALAPARLLAREGGTEIWLTPAVAGPMAAGVLRRHILLPADFKTRYAPAERRLALLHEGAHHDRGDLVANLVGLAVVAVHWWNPLAHIAWRAFRADQELACDATVLAGTDADDRQAYGIAVLKSACSRVPTAACAMNHKAQLKQRIAMMKHRPIGLLRHAIGALLAAFLVGGGLLLTASAAPPAPPAPPAPVAPPAPPAPAAAPAPVAPPAAAEWPAAPAPARPVAPSAAAADAAWADAAADQAAAAAERAALASDAARQGVAAARLSMAAARQGLAKARAEMAAECDKAGVPVVVDADLAKLAACNPETQQQIRTSVRASLHSARATMITDGAWADDERRHAIAGLDAALQRLDRQIAAATE